MGNFGRDNRSGGGRSFGGRSFGNNRPDRPDRLEMHKAICSECGNECMVPFRPTGSKPVFCSNCFEKKRDSGSGFRNPRFENKPRYDSDAGRPEQNTRQPQYDKQFESLNAKLDTILKILTPVAPVVVEEEKIVSETVVPEKKKRVSKKPVSTPEE